jgi:hypothetical protein
MAKVAAKTLYYCKHFYLQAEPALGQKGGRPVADRSGLTVAHKQA